MNAAVDHVSTAARAPMALTATPAHVWRPTLGHVVNVRVVFANEQQNILGVKTTNHRLLAAHLTNI